MSKPDPKDLSTQRRGSRGTVSGARVTLRVSAEPRSASIIAQWREYLPAECVDAMIKAGWHRQG